MVSIETLKGPWSLHASITGHILFGYQWELWLLLLTGSTGMQALSLQSRVRVSQEEQKKEPRYKFSQHVKMSRYLGKDQRDLKASIKRLPMDANPKRARWDSMTCGTATRDRWHLKDKRKALWVTRASHGCAPCRGRTVKLESHTWWADLQGWRVNQGVARWRETERSWGKKQKQKQTGRQPFSSWTLLEV